MRKPTPTQLRALKKLHDGLTNKSLPTTTRWWLGAEYQVFLTGARESTLQALHKKRLIDCSLIYSDGAVGKGVRITPAGLAALGDGSDTAYVDAVMADHCEVRSNLFGPCSGKPAFVVRNARLGVVTLCEECLNSPGRRDALQILRDLRKPRDVAKSPTSKILTDIAES